MSLGGAEPGVIDDTNYASVLPHVNLALLALYKRFPLKEGRILVQLTPGKITYPLQSAYAVNNGIVNATPRYLLDTVEVPFADDIFKVEAVYTESGWEMGLNDKSDEFSIVTPSATLLQVPWDIAAQIEELPTDLRTTTLDVVYRAMHRPLVVGLGVLDPETVEVELPYSHLEPLLLFIASRINGPIGMTSASTNFNMGNNYAAKYEASCQALEVANLRVDQGSQNNRIVSNGWV